MPDITEYICEDGHVSDSVNFNGNCLACSKPVKKQEKVESIFIMSIDHFDFYARIGVFHTLDEAIAEIEKANEEDRRLDPYDHGDEEQILIHELTFGMSKDSDEQPVYNMIRERIVDDQDNWAWKMEEGG